MSREIININYYVSSLPVQVKLQSGKIVEREHMNGYCNTILCAIIDMKDKGQKAQPSTRSLANLIGGSVRTVIRSIDTLVRSGYLVKVRRGCRLTNMYKISLRLWKRLFVGLKKVYGAVEKVVEEAKSVIKEVPRPTFPLTTVSKLGIMEAIQMLEDNYEEAIKPI